MVDQWIIDKLKQGTKRLTIEEIEERNKKHNEYMKLFEQYKIENKIDNLKELILSGSIVQKYKFCMEEESVDILPEIFQETLIDHFVKILGNKLIYDDIYLDDIIEKINIFCKQNGIELYFIQNNRIPKISGDLINDNIIEIRVPIKYSNKDLIFTILHEISHYITNTSSNNKLKQFISDPNNFMVNIYDITSLKREINYFMSPAELANWAFTLALHIYSFTNLSAIDLYGIIRNDISRLTSDNKHMFKSDYYNNLPNELKSFYHIIFYIFQLHNLNVKRESWLKEKNRLISFINLIDKYVKRLKKLFGNKSIDLPGTPK